MVFVPTPYTGGPSYSVVDSGSPTVNALLSGVAWGTVGPSIPVSVSYSFPEQLVPSVWSPDPIGGYDVPVPGTAEPWDAAYRGLAGETSGWRSGTHWPLGRRSAASILSKFPIWR